MNHNVPFNARILKRAAVIEYIVASHLLSYFIVVHETGFGWLLPAPANISI